VQLYHHSPNTPSWRGALLRKAQEQLLLGMSHIMSKVLQSEILSVSRGVHYCFKSSIRGRKPLITDDDDDYKFCMEHILCVNITNTTTE
jgi:hypothetical protein